MSAPSLRETTSLRETKKAATRLALGRAVVRLATRDGLDHVTIDAVAAEAGVSVRTFHNYFGGKEDALLAFVAMLFDLIMEGIDQRPAGESFWESVRFTLIEVATSPEVGEPAEFVTLLRLLDSEPSLTAHSRRAELMCSIDERVEDLFEARGHGRADLYPHLTIATAIATSRAALEHWVTRSERTTDPTESPEPTDPTTTEASVREVLESAFDQVGSGLANPLPHLKEL